uniref:Sushi domain containing 2 n=1 Tax=Callorhinchus milii TaxID=7868 RepID=A0A4W3HPH9_CALMI
MSQSQMFLTLFPDAQNSCENNCGQRLTTCSCHVTCEPLGNCCQDYRDYCLQISPQSGTLMGGTDFFTVNATFKPTDKIVCRFKSEIDIEGYVDGERKAHCISPLLFENGRVPFELSTDGGQTFSRRGTWVSVQHNKYSYDFKSILLNATKWQYYGTPNVTGNLTLLWKKSPLFPGLAVNVELWGYRETGEPYTDNWRAEWKFLYTLGEGVPNTGYFTFVPKPAEKPHSDWEIGALRLTNSNESVGIQNVRSVWSSSHALAWHLEETFRRDSAAWAYSKCLAWHETEQTLPNFLSEIADCPCTLAQARADTGRFHTDYGCDIEQGSLCTYHPGAVHCVRAIQASPRYGAGQQCCYNAEGRQILTGDSLGGSTPDRGHDWGSPPYLRPPRVPGNSHWLYDVISFYYCCLWSDNCHYYFLHRPSSDCRTYRPPKAGATFGDPHLYTFDGKSFTFNGKGEYTLLNAAVNVTDQWLRVQGRTELVQDSNGKILAIQCVIRPQCLSLGEDVNATRFTAVAMQEGDSDVIEVRVSNDSQSDSLEVLLNQGVLSFAEQKWMDLSGVFVYKGSPLDVTVMFSSGAGVEVKGRGAILGIVVLLPEEFTNQTEGLFGVMNGDPDDDLGIRNGSLLPGDASPEQLYEMGGSWAIENETSLFTYDSEFLLDNYYHAPKHDPDFSPVFTPGRASENDSLHSKTVELCQGDAFCKFDTLVTGNFQVGNATKFFHENYNKLVGSLEQVIACGFVEEPKNGKKEGIFYLAGATVNFTCKANYILAGSAHRTCQADGQWSGKQTFCVAGKLHPQIQRHRNPRLIYLIACVSLSEDVKGFAVLNIGPNKMPLHRKSGINCIPLTA